MRTFEQFLTQKGFVSNEMLQAAMQAVQAWQPHSEQDLKSQRPPLTHFLVKLKAISLEKLVAAVDEYLSLSRSKLNESQANPEIQSNAQTASKAVQSEELPFAEKPEFRAAPINLAADYCEALNEDKLAEIEGLILQWDRFKNLSDTKSRSELEGSLRQVYREFHTIKGTARFIHAVMTEKLIHQAEDLLSFAQKFTARLSSKDIERLVSVNLKMFDQVWNLRNALLKAGNEENAWNDLMMRNHYFQAYKELSGLMREFQSRDYEVDLNEIKDLF